MTRIALITGANRGLGRSTALHLAEAGTDLILTYRSHADEAEAVVEAARKLGRTAVALRLDTGDTAGFPAFAAQVREVLDREWGRDDLDILVNNAGHGVHAPFAETTEEQFDGLMNVHVKGVFFLTQALLPLIKDGGRILNVSTGLTRFIAAPTAAYARPRVPWKSSPGTSPRSWGRAASRSTPSHRVPPAPTSVAVGYATTRACAPC